jgi:hypothetical protein
MVFSIVAVRTLTVADRTRRFTLEPGTPIYDPYLVRLVMRAGIRLRAY